ncbi:MAG TPA: beta-eliminating lyase-related protein [Burkholderiaceae bacterium]|jgi:threonine aldolase|nr:beta-eliminating lyase-related protein [Burkholderiaceae bacterium]
MQFGSDNQTGCSAPVMQALMAANAGHSHGYGDDDWTGRASAALAEVFQTELDAFLVTTGTAANGLALASLVQPWQLVLCHAQSHLATDESTAPEWFTSGARVHAIAADQPKLTADALRGYLARAGRDHPHNPQPGAVSIAQSTECGLVYSADEIASIAECARAHGMALHMDGARFANALVASGGCAADLSWRAGVDVLTLGASKNGCWAAEAILVFRRELSAGLAHRRKRAGHLVAKGRLLGAQMSAWLQDGHWLALAAHANRQAAQLARRLSEVPGIEQVWAVEANALFVLMPRAMALALQADGAEFYEWYASALPPGRGLPPDQMFVRLVCSFATTDEEIDTFVGRAVQHSAT